MGAFPVTVKTLDALHLASAEIFAQSRPNEELLVFTRDAGMNRAAAALGFPTPLATGRQ